MNPEVFSRILAALVPSLVFGLLSAGSLTLFVWLLWIIPSGPLYWIPTGMLFFAALGSAWQLFLVPVAFVASLTE